MVWQDKNIDQIGSSRYVQMTDIWLREGFKKKIYIFTEFSMGGSPPPPAPLPPPVEIINFFPTIYQIFVFWYNRPEIYLVWYHKFLSQILAELEHFHWWPSWSPHNRMILSLCVWLWRGGGLNLVIFFIDFFHVSDHLEQFGGVSFYFH